LVHNSLWNLGQPLPDMALVGRDPEIGEQFFTRVKNWVSCAYYLRDQFPGPTLDT